MTERAAPNQTDDLAQLRLRTTAAIAELDLLRVDDPAAVAALRALRLTRLTLECLWLPAIDTEVERVGASREPMPRS